MCTLRNEAASSDQVRLWFRCSSQAPPRNTGSVTKESPISAMNLDLRASARRHISKQCASRYKEDLKCCSWSIKAEQNLLERPRFTGRCAIAPHTRCLKILWVMNSDAGHWRLFQNGDHCQRLGKRIYDGPLHCAANAARHPPAYRLDDQWPCDSCRARMKDPHGNLSRMEIYYYCAAATIHCNHLSRTTYVPLVIVTPSYARTPSWLRRACPDS